MSSFLMLPLLCGYTSRLFNAQLATPLLRIGQIFVAKKIFVTPSVLRLQKWFFNQNGEEFNHKSKSEVCNVLLVAGCEQEDQKLEKRCL